MTEGIEALYGGRPARAVAVFREVLAAMPSHYGASYQLAVALDAVADHGQAELQWQEVVRSARAAGDAATADLASQRAAAARRAARMKEGLRLLDESEPEKAAEVFRQVLAELPTHYGASFHLARALERSGRPDEAIDLWRVVLKMAQGYHDGPTQEIAGEAIVGLETTPIMEQGLAELYEHRRPEEAAKRFRSVLEVLPTHYGATYQLAVALDAAGLADEARPFWEKALEMARSYRDEAVVVTAQARLTR
jgi:tetratricopeptide (TPR) repeat protein